MSRADLAIIQKKSIVPVLAQAVNEFQNNNLAKSNQYLMQVFRQIDVKKDEIEIFNYAKSEMSIADGKIVKSRSIAFMAREYGRDLMVLNIKLLLANLNEYFNVKQGLTMTQLDEIAEQIIEECGKTLFLDELIYIFKKAKLELKLYERLDGSIIWGLIDNHYHNRIAQRDKQHNGEKQEDFLVNDAVALVGKYGVVGLKYQEREQMRADMNAGFNVTDNRMKAKKKTAIERLTFNQAHEFLEKNAEALNDADMTAKTSPTAEKKVTHKKSSKKKKKK